ncbi:TPA: hypothetical protein QHU27_006063, partial [Klebsiella michiganensis]|nr:hypothetical protein [Klebsiella michiganensis]
SSGSRNKLLSTLIALKRLPDVDNTLLTCLGKFDLCILGYPGNVIDEVHCSDYAIANGLGGFRPDRCFITLIFEGDGVIAVAVNEECQHAD